MTAQAAAPTPLPSAAISTADLPRGVRNNNPGNIDGMERHGMAWRWINRLTRAFACSPPRNTASARWR